ncbi:MAG: Gfo/Idh/MocA family oxidoreductase [Actinomycetota bacterium]|nr:Gfo/Idh/MocA family oxidoreductase [Actinomycetota bacterium]
MSRLRAVLVGAGGMGKAWAGALVADPRLDLVGWVDVVEERAREAVGALGLTATGVEADVGTALSRHSPDFVVDVSVPEAHYEVTATCLRRGVPVLGEKPMAATMAEARALVELSERTSTLFAVSQNRRYNAGLVAFKDLVATRLGGVSQLNAEFYRAPHFGGFREEMASPLLLDMAIHTFDAARYVTGADATSVVCSELNPPWSWYEGSACAVADLEMTGGLRFTYQGSWCAQGFETSWDSSWRAVGRLGTALWDGTGAPVAEVEVAGSDATERLEAQPAEGFAGGIAGSLADFVSALGGGDPPMGECHDNIRSLAMVFAALESSRTGARVAVEA